MQMCKLWLSKIGQAYIWRRILLERFTEPLHLNVISMLVALLGSWKQKVSFDLVLRQHNAYGILWAAEQCKSHGISSMAICEFGVGTGTGLINMANIAQKVTALTGVHITVFGLDSGVGLPTAPIDYRDHPEHYTKGDHQMDVPALRAKLPPNTRLILGEIKDTVGDFLNTLEAERLTLGYVVVDVDYYTSTRDALKVCMGPASLYLPLTLMYLDDIGDVSHHPSAGELLAVAEFNGLSEARKIYQDPFLENRRIFRRANWIKHMRTLHVLDHPQRTTEKNNTVHLHNPYL